MIRPVDLQTAYSAIPDHAKQHAMDLISHHYRQMQGLGEARKENLVRPERVIPSTDNATITMDHRGRAAVPKKMNTGSDGIRATQSYAPASRGKSPSRGDRFEEIGGLLDLTA